MNHFAALLFLVVFVFAAPAYAIEVICRVLEKHVPEANVTYQPGVDVHGKAVAPADLGGGAQFQLPEIIKIPLSVDLGRRLGLDYSSTELTAPLGILEVYPDGRVMQNGQDLSTQAYALCGK